MRVLIFIPKDIDNVNTNHEFVLTLNHLLGDSIEIDISHKIPSSIKEYSLIHIIGAWNMTSAKMLNKACKHFIPMILSPLGGFQPWVIKKNKTSNSIKKIIYQKEMAQKASAIHVCNNLELKNFENYGWNKNIQLIKNSVTTNDTTDDEMAEEILRLYRKVIDSNCYPMINENARNSIYELLLIGIDPDIAKSEKNSKETISYLQILTEDDWRYIFIYAYDEGIMEYINIGIEKLHFNFPNIDVKKLDRFTSSQLINIEPLESKKLLSSSIILKNKLNNLELEENEKTEEELCIMFHNLRYEIRQGNASMRHLSDLYKKIKFNNINEDKLSEILNYTGIIKFASRIVFILKDVIGLTDGFMPINGLDDRITDKIRRTITKLK